MYCNNLQTVKFTGSQTCIRWNCFSEYINLTTITIPATITKVERDAFLNCSKLAHVQFRGSINQRNAMDISDDDGNDFFKDAGWECYYSGD